MSLGEGHSLIVKQDGSMWAAGANNFGQLGTGLRTKFKPYFVEVFLGGVIAVTAGSEHSMVLKHDGSVWATGRNEHGQLGDGSDIDRGTFVEVISSDAKAMAAGSQHSLVVKRDGSLWVTGSNIHGQLGDGLIGDRMIFVQVFLSGAENVAAGVDHSMVLGQDGSVWTAGANFFGQLGDGSTISKHSFVQVLPAGAKAIAAGGYHSMVLKGDGTVWTMGDNKHGQLGDGSMTSKIFVHPIIAGTGSSAKAIAAGFLHSIVLHENGSVWVAGANLRGQLGDGSTKSWDENRDICFVSVVSRGARAVAAGHFHSMILKRDGAVWATGSNAKGQLGDGSMVAKNTYVRVAQTSERGRWCMPKIYGSKRPCLFQRDFITH